MRPCRSVEERFGGIDILVNNAALFDLRPDRSRSPARATTGCSPINVAGVLFTMQAVARSMIARGQRRQDHQHGQPGGPSRRAAGRGLLRHQGGRHQPHPIGGPRLIAHGINVNAIAPGVVDGEHWDGVDALFAKYENRPLRREEAPRRRGGARRPHGHAREDLTGMAVFLASAESDYVVAQTYNVDGGNWMS